MIKTSQKKAIMDRLDYYLSRGMTDKMEIFTKVVDDLKVPRPTVRKVARELREIYDHKILVLQSEWSEIGKNLT